MATSSSYPPPPPYYRLYGDYLQDPKSAPEPPPPVQGTYPLFGATYTTEDDLPSLEDQGVRQLYPKGPNIDYKKELKALNRELQLHLLELADVLVERPSQYARRVEDISLIFKNLHHLLNSLRPHQARATLIHILELQIHRRKQAIEDIKSILLNIGQVARAKLDGLTKGFTYELSSETFIMRCLWGIGSQVSLPCHIAWLSFHVGVWGFAASCSMGFMKH